MWLEDQLGSCRQKLNEWNGSWDEEKFKLLDQFYLPIENKITGFLHFIAFVSVCLLFAIIAYAHSHIVCPLIIDRTK